MQRSSGNTGKDCPGSEVMEPASISPFLSEALSILLAHANIALAVVNRRVRVIECHGAALTKVAPDTPASDAFPVLVGCEDLICAIIDGRENETVIPNVACGSARAGSEHFLTITLRASHVAGHCLVMIRDTTDAARLHHRAMQQHNEIELARKINHQQQLRLAEAQRIAHVGYWEYEALTSRLTLSEGALSILDVDDGSASGSMARVTGRIHYADRHEFRRFVYRCCLTDGPSEIECRIVRTNGEVRHVKINGEVRKGSGNVIRAIFGTVFDFTEHWRAERALRAAKESAERANLAKTKFIAAASHDLRQPLFALNLYMETLGFLTQGRHDVRASEVETIAEKMRGTLARFSNLLNGILDLSKLEAGVTVPEKRDFPIQTILDRMRADYTDRAEAKTLDFRVKPCSAVVYSDPHLLTRIVDNLVSNAIRYTSKGRIVVGCRHNGMALTLQVWDTGVGMSEEERKHIFEEFRQGARAPGHTDVGLGLGLFIVDQLARMLDHRIDVRSAIDKGSMFAVSIPLVRSASDSETPAEEAASFPSTQGGSARGRILLVDDEDDILDASASLLHSWGFEVITAHSSREATRKLTTTGINRLDLVLVDFRLSSGEKGTQAISEIRSKLGREVPAAIITGDTSPERLKEVEQSGFMLAHKPLRADELRSLIAKAVQHT